MSASIYSSAAIHARITELTDEAAALGALAAAEAREATTEEAARFDAILAEIGDANQRTGLYAQLDKAVRYENIRAHQAAPRNAVPQPYHAKPATVPAKPRAHGKLKAFTGADAAQDAYDCGMWLRAAVAKGNDRRAMDHISSRGLELRNAATEGTGSAGGYLVPDPLSSAIIDVVERYAVIRPLCRVVQMTSDTLTMAKRLTGVTVDYPGEAGAIDGSDKTWGNVALTAVKRATLSKVSSELNEDAVINVMDDLAMEIGRAFGLQEDNEIINGDGSGTYGGETGIASALHANAVTLLTLSPGTAFSEITLPHITTIVAALPEKYHTLARFLMRRSTWHGVVVPLLTASGIGNTADLQSQLVPQLYGYPVVFSDAMPATGASKFAMFFGSFLDGVTIGDRRGITIGTSADYAFNEDVVTVRATRRYDINVHSTGSAAGDRAIVGLKTDPS